ncbi:MAG: hypothetical protein IJW40_10005 [Clostridia bacterium]|nr:hypothetical protein [Clostridia bacterium]
MIRAKETFENAWADLKEFCKNYFEICKYLREIEQEHVVIEIELCFGIGFSTEFGGVGLELISRMDIAGAQYTNGEVKTGHFGKSAADITILGMTFGPQRTTFEPWNMTNPKERIVNDPTYFDAGVSAGGAVAFGVGVHFNVSVSVLGLITDYAEYFYEKYKDLGYLD